MNIKKYINGILLFISGAIAYQVILIFLPGSTVVIDIDNKELGRLKFDHCISRSDEGFIPPLSKELTRRGIEHEIRGSKLCYKGGDKEELMRADSFVRSFRNGVATILSDKETEARIASWLTKEQKFYRITKTTNGKRFLVIDSNSEDDAEKNRKELTKLERGE